MRWTITRHHTDDGGAQSVAGPVTGPIEVVPASYTDEDVERVAEALENWPGHADDIDWPSLARFALDAYLKDPA